MQAAHDIRFQPGQFNHFKAALIRPGAWHSYIARTLAGLGLPEGLAALPLIESDYNPRAYSSAGAAGLWQFMPATGRHFMTIDRAVDDRLDPFRETKAAAELLAEDHRLLGTWPLAITAYHQDVAGVRQAIETMRTTHISTIVRHYRSPAFGFAGRNFYVSFLAALEIERDPHRFIGPITPRKEERTQQLTLPAHVPVQALERVLNIEPGVLRELNPALPAAVWTGRLDVPKGYRLRLPGSDTGWTSTALAARLDAGELPASRPMPPRYRARTVELPAGMGGLYRTSSRSDVLRQALTTADAGTQSTGSDGKWGGFRGNEAFNAEAGSSSRASDGAPRPPYHMHVDRRYGSDHAYPDRGSVVRHLPKGATAAYYAGISYWLDGAVWYERWPSTSAFLVVAPPIGIVVRSLPAFVRRVSHRSETFLYANDVFYRPRPALGGFQVVNDPAAGTSAPRGVDAVMPVPQATGAALDRPSVKAPPPVMAQLPIVAEPPVMARTPLKALVPVTVLMPIKTLTPVADQELPNMGSPLQATTAALAPRASPGAKYSSLSTLSSPETFTLQALDGQSVGQQVSPAIVSDGPERICGHVQ